MSSVLFGTFHRLSFHVMSSILVHYFVSIQEERVLIGRNIIIGLQIEASLELLHASRLKVPDQLRRQLPLSLQDNLNSVTSSHTKSQVLSIYAQLLCTNVICQSQNVFNSRVLLKLSFDELHNI